MRGLMSEQPLLISMLIQHAANFHGDVGIVSRTVDGVAHRYTYADAERRSRQLAQALHRLGIEPGDRVGTPRLNVTPSASNSSKRLAPSRRGPGSTSFAPLIAAA